MKQYFHSESRHNLNRYQNMLHVYMSWGVSQIFLRKARFYSSVENHLSIVTWSWVRPINAYNIISLAKYWLSIRSWDGDRSAAVRRCQRRLSLRQLMWTASQTVGPAYRRTREPMHLHQCRGFVRPFYREFINIPAFGTRIFQAWKLDPGARRLKLRCLAQSLQFEKPPENF